MYPKTRITRFILWLWKRYHCPHELHLWQEECVCDACGEIIGELILETNHEDPNTPEWACMDYEEENHTFAGCFVCMQNYNYFMENEE